MLTAVHRRIIEWFGLEGTLKITQFQPPAMSRDIFHQTRLLKAPSSLALNPVREGTATTCSTPSAFKGWLIINVLNSKLSTFWMKCLSYEYLDVRGRRKQRLTFYLPSTAEAKAVWLSLQCFVISLLVEWGSLAFWIRSLRACACFQLPLTGLYCSVLELSLRWGFALWEAVCLKQPRKNFIRWPRELNVAFAFEVFLVRSLFLVWIQMELTWMLGVRCCLCRETNSSERDEVECAEVSFGLEAPRCWPCDSSLFFPSLRCWRAVQPTFVTS